jgi:hypothetical protein
MKKKYYTGNVLSCYSTALCYLLARCLSLSELNEKLRLHLRLELSSHALRIGKKQTSISWLAYSLSLFLLIASLLNAKAQTWGVPVIAETPVGTGGFIGQFNSMTIVNGNPAMVYYDFLHQNLMYVRATDASGSAWGTPVTVDATGDVGYYTSLAIVNGNPAISYYDVTNADLKYARATDASGSAWGTPIRVDGAT